MPSFWFETIGTDIILHNKYGIYSKNELERQLQEGHLTLEDLGEIYSLTMFQIVHVIRLLKITHRNILSDTRIPDLMITPSMHQILIGTLLGDAYMGNKRSYRLAHSIHQMDYLYHVAGGLGQTVSTVSYSQGDLGRSLSLWTNRHDLFESYYHWFYQKKGKKMILQESVQNLESEGLAYWYMDDGKYGEYGFELSTGGFSVPELDILVSLLQNKFSLSVTQQFHDTVRGYRYLYIKAESRSQFLSLIEPYVIPSMRYKLDGTPYPKLQNEMEIASRHLDFCRKVGRPVRFTGNTAIEEIVNRENIDSRKKVYMESIKTLMREGKQISITNMRKEPSEEELKNMLVVGLTDEEIGRKYGFGRNRVSKLRRDLNIPRKAVRKKMDRSKFPCLNTVLVRTDKIESNEYNPNKVACPEMDLLIHSISEDGLTQPVVVYYDSERDKYIVIDGFHRYIILRDHFKYEKIPVVILHKSLKDRMASTIRHNRARGKHQVDLMGILVKNLSDQGWSDVEIAGHLGMEGEELLRLRQQVGCAKLLAGGDYNKAWRVQ